MLKPLVLALLVTVLVPSAKAFSLKEKKWLEETKKQLAESVYPKKIKEVCGVDIPLTFEEKMGPPFMAANASLSSYCEEPLSTIWHMCEDATSKTEIVKKVKKVSCVLGKEKEVEFKLNGTELVMTVGVDASNLGEKAKKFLEDHL